MNEGKKERVEHVTGQPHPKKIQATPQQKRYRLVEQKASKHPILNVDLLKRKGKKVHIAEGVIGDQPFRIGVRRGVPLEFQFMLNQTSDVFALRRDKTAGEDDQPEAEENKSDWKSIEESNRSIREIMVASTVVVIDENDEPLINQNTGQYIPLFSLNGVGGDFPIEHLDDLTLLDLYDAVKEVQAPEAAAAVLNQFQEGSPKRRTRRKKSGT